MHLFSVEQVILIKIRFESPGSVNFCSVFCVIARHLHSENMHHLNKFYFALFPVTFRLIAFVISSSAPTSTKIKWNSLHTCFSSSAQQQWQRDDIAHTLAFMPGKGICHPLILSACFSFSLLPLLVSLSISTIDGTTSSTSATIFPVDACWPMNKINILVRKWTRSSASFMVNWLSSLSSAQFILDIFSLLSH